MDREKILNLKHLLEDILGDNQPSDEDLDFDEDAIKMYAAMHSLLEAIYEYGF